MGEEAMRGTIRFGAAPRNRRGMALVYAVFGTFVVASMVAVMFTMAGTSDAQADVRRGEARARLMAEGALEAIEKSVRTDVANWDDPVRAGTMEIAGQPIDVSVVELGAEQDMTDPSGIVTRVQPYELSASVMLDGVREVSRTIVNVERMPLFQFAVFYDGDLEIHAGPDLTLRGRVHSNADMYLGGGNTITLDTNYVHAIGEIYRQRKFQGAAGGNVDIRQWVANPFSSSEPSHFERMLSESQFSATSTTSGYDSLFEGFDANGDGDFYDLGDWLPFEFGAMELWGTPAGYGGTEHTVMTGAHGLTEAVTPEIGSIQMYEETVGGDYLYDEIAGTYTYDPGNGTHDRGYYYDNAGMSVIVDAARNIVVHDESGNDITSFVSSAITLASVPDMRQSGSTSTQTPVIEIDMQALAATGRFPSNGLVYAAFEEMGTGTEARGVMLTNGSELPGSLTVATQGPLYVHGDYNTVDKKGAAVIGDAVNLLSNAWDGTKAPGNLPGATPTTYNVAMITGSYTSEANRYNGGLENLPRFHENWNSVACNISGSFVNIFDSAFATGDWRYGSDRYTAPQRNWQYDPMFNSIANLPPFTPMAVSASRIVSW